MSTSSAHRNAQLIPWAALSALGFVAACWAYVVGHGADLHAYWSVDLGNLYGRTTGIQALDGFFYAPPVAVLLSPLHLLSWPVARLAWLLLQLVALRTIAGRWAFAAVLLPPVWIDLYFGNVMILFAAMAVLGFRHPSAWLFGLLTKVTPGIGLVWFVARREWAHLARVAAVLAGIVAISVLLQGPGVWAAWIATLLRLGTLPIAPDALQVPLLPRIVVAVAVVALAARTDRRWLVPVAMTIAMPTLWPDALVPLVAVPFLTSRPIDLTTLTSPLRPRAAARVVAAGGATAPADAPVEASPAPIGG